MGFPRAPVEPVSYLPAVRKDVWASPAITTSSVRMELSVSINLCGKLLSGEISVPISIK